MGKRLHHFRILWETLCFVENHETLFAGTTELRELPFLSPLRCSDLLGNIFTLIDAAVIADEVLRRLVHVLLIHQANGMWDSPKCHKQ